MQFAEVTLEAPDEARGELETFYLDRLGFRGLARGGDDILAFEVGSEAARWSAAPPSAAPFYHFALLVPGNHFGAALTWLAARARLLPDPDTGDTTFDFDNWNALACYCLDPVGNIFELIAHRGIAETTKQGPFAAREVIGFSEVGLVVPDKVDAAAKLERSLGLQAWDGEVDNSDRLVFVGEKAKTLILSHPGRGWLPTGRPAEVHPVRLSLTGALSGEARIGRHHLFSF